MCDVLSKRWWFLLPGSWSAQDFDHHKLIFGKFTKNFTLCVCLFWGASERQNFIGMSVFFHASSNCLHVSFCRNIWCSWKVYHPCVFFHVQLTPFFWRTCTHIESTGMVCCLHESFYVFSRCLDRNTSSCNRDSWKVYRQCGFFRASSNYLIVYICIHIESSWMVYHSCEFFHVSSNW